jgi:hypothetical protein
VRGREALARCLRPFVLTPEGEPGQKHYRATGALNLSLILKTPASNHLEAGVSDKTLCGGARSEFPPQSGCAQSAVHGGHPGGPKGRISGLTGPTTGLQSLASARTSPSKTIARFLRRAHQRR